MERPKIEQYLLAIINNDTGRDLQLEELGPPIREARNFEEPLTELPFEPNKEGYVVRFSSGLRLKVKSEEYVRLHRLLTQVNSKDIYEWVRDGRDLENFSMEFLTNSILS